MACPTKAGLRSPLPPLSSLPSPPFSQEVCSDGFAKPRSTSPLTVKSWARAANATVNSWPNSRIATVNPVARGMMKRILAT
jgi:hypothetical protein